MLPYLCVKTRGKYKSVCVCVCVCVRAHTCVHAYIYKRKHWKDKLRLIKNGCRDVPGGSGVKTLGSQITGPRFDPWSGN